MRASASILALSAFMSLGLWAGGNGSSASATTSVRIVRPLVLSSVQDLYFGALLVESAGSGRLIQQRAAYNGGTRDADPAGISQVAQSTEHWHNAEFEVRGEPGASFTVYLPKDPIQLKVPSGATMPTIKLNYHTENSIDTSGMTRMWIGGTLQLPANPSYGHYQKSVPVTVAYY